MTFKTPEKEIRGRKLRTYFDGKELKDATMPLSIPVLPVDQAIAEAMRSDDVNAVERFTDCLVAQACTRVFGSDSKVAFMRNTAWVSLPGEKYALRYAINADARRMVAGFDKEEHVEVGSMVHLMVPDASHSLVHYRKRKKEWRKRNPEFQSGDTRPRKTQRKQPAPDPLHGVVRNGAYVRL